MNHEPAEEHWWARQVGGLGWGELCYRPLLLSDSTLSPVMGGN